MMKKLICKICLVFLVSGALNMNALLAHTAANDPVRQSEVLKKGDFSKSINKEFPISAEGKIDLSNKYGKVNVHAWSQNKVKIDVTISVKASSESQAQETFDRITVEFENTADYVRGETMIEPQKKGWASSWWGSGSSSEFTIDYEVYMPKTGNLDLANKYGHSSIEKISGRANVVAKYGDVRIDGLDNHLTLDVGYGNASIGAVKDAEIIIKYGKLRMEDARDINLESKYSKVYISNAGDIETISKYDTYRLGKVRELHNQGKYDDFEIESAQEVTTITRYSDFDIHRLLNRGKFNMDYGGLHIGSLAKDFSKFEVDSRYTGIEVEIDEGAQYELDVRTDYAGINFPSEADINLDVRSGNSREVKGFVGGKSSKSLVHVRASYGSVKVR